MMAAVARLMFWSFAPGHSKLEKRSKEMCDVSNKWRLFMMVLVLFISTLILRIFTLGKMIAYSYD